MLVVRSGEVWTGSPASIIMPSPTYIATCPSHTTRSPGRSWSWVTCVPTVCASASRGMSTPAWAYAQCVSPEQSRPTPGVFPPHWYGVPMALRAASTACSAWGEAPLAGACDGGGGAAGGVETAGGWATGTWPPGAVFSAGPGAGVDAPNDPDAPGDPAATSFAELSAGGDSAGVVTAADGGSGGMSTSHCGKAGDGSSNNR